MCALKRIQKELTLFASKPLPNIEVTQDSSNPFLLEVSILAPTESVLANKQIKANILLTDEYPVDAPKVFFVTPIYHFNVVQSDGAVCFPFLQAWQSNFVLVDVYNALYAIILKPDDTCVIEQEIYKEYKEDPALYMKKASQLKQKWN